MHGEKTFCKSNCRFATDWERTISSFAKLEKQKRKIYFRSENFKTIHFFFFLREKQTREKEGGRVRNWVGVELLSRFHLEEGGLTSLPSWIPNILSLSLSLSHSLSHCFLFFFLFCFVLFCYGICHYGRFSLLKFSKGLIVMLYLYFHVINSTKLNERENASNGCRDVVLIYQKCYWENILKIIGKFFMS